MRNFLTALAIILGMFVATVTMAVSPARADDGPVSDAYAMDQRCFEGYGQPADVRAFCLENGFKLTPYRQIRHHKVRPCTRFENTYNHLTWYSCGTWHKRVVR